LFYANVSIDSTSNIVSVQTNKEIVVLTSFLEKETYIALKIKGIYNFLPLYNKQVTSNKSSLLLMIILQNTQKLQPNYNGSYLQK
jgi:hypothetical protein